MEVIQRAVGLRFRRLVRLRVIRFAFAALSFGIALLITLPEPSLLAQLGSPLQPSLSIQISTNGQVQLQWSSQFQGAELEQAELLNPAFWQPAPQTPSLQGGVYRITIDATNSTTFYRLRQTVTGFQVTSHTPLDGAVDVGCTIRPQVFFSKPVNPATLNSSNFFASFGGQKLPATIVPANDGSFAWLFLNAPMPGGAQLDITVVGSTILPVGGGKPLDAAANGTPGSLLQFTFTTVSLAALVGTALTGIVVDPGPDLIPGTPDDVQINPDGTKTYLLPIAGVNVSLLGMQNQTLTTGTNGQFFFPAVPSGDVKVVFEGLTATNPPTGYYFPEMVIDSQMVLGLTNFTMQDGPAVYLPRIASNILQTVSATSTNSVTATAAGAPSLSAFQRSQLTLTIASNSLIGANGQLLPSAQVGISTVPSQLVMDMLPSGVLQHTFDITIQAPGVATFSTPAALTFPNVFNAAPGTKLDFLSFDHTTGRLVIEGTATVSADGATVRTDPGTGVTHPGWHGLTPPGNLSGPPCPGNPKNFGSIFVRPQVSGIITLDGQQLQMGSRNFLFKDDQSQLLISFANAAVPLSSDRCSDFAMSATPLEVELQYDHTAAKAFLSGLPETPVRLWPGETANFLVKMQPLADPAKLKKLNGANLTDTIFGISLTVIYRQRFSDGTAVVLTEDMPQPFFIYRYLDALDTDPSDGKLEFPAALAEGSQKVARRRPVMNNGAVPAMLQPDDFTNFDVDQLNSALVFHPQSIAEDLSTRLHVLAPDGREADGSSSIIDRTIHLAGTGTPIQRVNINKTGLTNVLRQIAQSADPGPQVVKLTALKSTPGLFQFCLSFMGDATSLLPFEASEDDVKLALENLSAIEPGNVVVNRQDETASVAFAPTTTVFTVQFQGKFLGMTVPNLGGFATGLDKVVANDPGIGQSWSIIFNSAAPNPSPSSSFSIIVNKTPTRDIPANADGPTVEAFLAEVVGAGNVSVGKTTAPAPSSDGPFFVTQYVLNFVPAAAPRGLFATSSDGTRQINVKQVFFTGTRQITPNERALFNTDALRQGLADDFAAALPSRYSGVDSGIMVEDGDPNNAVTLNWSLTGTALGLGGSAGGEGGYGVDNAAEITQVVGSLPQYNQAAQNLLLSKALNQHYTSIVEIYPASVLALTHLFPLELSRQQFLNFTMGSVAHETAHSMGATHTAKVNFPPKTVVNAQQVLALSGGGSADSYILNFAGYSTFPIARNADMVTVADALNGLGFSADPVFTVTGPDGGPFQITCVSPEPEADDTLDGTIVPQLTGTGSGGMVVTVAPLAQGQSAEQWFADVLAKLPLGTNDLMGNNIDRSLNDGSYGFIAGYTKEKLKLGLKLEWTAAEAQTALKSYQSWLSFGGFQYEQIQAGQIDDSEDIQLLGPRLAVHSAQDDLDPRALDFGALNLSQPGGPTNSTTITLESFGTDDLILNQVTLSGTNGAFNLQAIAPGTIIAASNSLTLQLFFNPPTSGDFQDVLTIDSNDTNGVFEIDLSGTAVSAGPDLRVYFDNNNLGGASIQGGSVSVANFATITNAGLQPLVISNILVASGSDEFILGGLPAGFGPSQPLVLQPGGSFSFSLGFEPNTIGLQRSEVQIISNDPNTPVYHLHVVGTGLAASGNPLDSLHYGNDYVALETPDLEGSPVLRVKSDGEGNWSLFLPPNQRFHAAIFDPISGLIAHIYGLTAPSGQPTQMPAFPVFLASTAFDTDGDGLPDDVEFAVGTDPTKVNTTGTGPDDFDKVEQGLDPLAGTTLETGVIASLPLADGKANAIALASAPNDPSKLLAYLAVGPNPSFADAFNGLAIVDLSQFNKPAWIGQLALPFGSSPNPSPKAISIDSSVQVAAALVGNALDLVDVSDPANPKLISTVDLNKPAAVLAFNGVVYVGTGTNLLSIDPLSGNTLQTLALPGQPIVGLAHDESILYSVDSGGTLRTIELSGDQMIARGSLTVTNAQGRLLVGNGVAYVLMQPAFPTGGGYSTVDVSDPANPKLLQGADLPSGTRAPSTALAINGSGLGLLIGSFGGPGVLDVMNVSIPTNNYVFLNRFNLPAPPNDVAEAAGIAYVADDSAGLQVVNYMAFNGQPPPPTVTVSPATPSADTNAVVFEALAGSTIPLRVTISDAAQVRNVELLANGQVVSTADSFPFDFAVVTPNFNPNATNFVVQVRVTDASGNVTLSAPFQVVVVRDPGAPQIVSLDPPNGAIVPSDFSVARVTFSKPMAVPTLNATNLQILDALGQPVTLPDFQVLTTNLPSGAVVSAAVLSVGRLQPGSYQFFIQASAIRDGSGNTLGSSNLTSSFIVDQFSIRWTNQLGGDWSAPTNWDRGRLPSVNDDVLVVVTNIVTGIFGPQLPPVFLQSASSPTNVVSIRSLTSNDELDLIGLTLSVADKISISNVFYLDAATLSGGTILANTDTVIKIGIDGVSTIPPALSIWQGVTVIGDLVQGTLQPCPQVPCLQGVSPITLEDSLTLNGTMKNFRLAVYDDVTLNGTGTFTADTLREWDIDGPLNAQINSGPGILTIGSNITVRGTVNLATQFGGAIINQGTLLAESFPPPSTANEGTSGAFINFNNGQLTNQGTIQVMQGGYLQLNGTFSSTTNPCFVNDGVLQVNTGGFFETVAGAPGTMIWSSDLTTVETGGAAALDGILLTAPGQTSILSGGGNWLLTGAGVPGTDNVQLKDGTVVLTNGAVLRGPVALNEVTLDGDLDLSQTNDFSGFIYAPRPQGGTFNNINVKSNITLNGTIRLGDSAGSLQGGILFDSRLDFSQPTNILDGNGTIIFGSHPANTLVDFAQLATLIIGPSITIRGQSFFVGGNTNSFSLGEALINIDNKGTIQADQPGGIVTLSTEGSVNGFTFGAWINEGTIHIGGGSQIIVLHDFVQSTLGTLAVDLGGPAPGTNYGQMTLTGPTTIAGALQLNLVNGYQPGIGDSFDIMRWASESGKFASVLGTNLPSGLVLELNYQPTGLILQTTMP